jgi:hypothetical protein
MLGEEGNMKIEIPDAISLILTLPAQSSSNEGHRKMEERGDLMIFTASILRIKVILKK